MNLNVIIPVGGEGKRMKPLTAEVSKAVVRFCNRPLVEMAMAPLAYQGVKKFIFGVSGFLNYRSIYDYFQSGAGFSVAYRIDPGIHIKYQPAVDDVGSADSLRILMDYYEIDSPSLVIQGDNIFDLNIKDMMKFHSKKNAFMTIGLVHVDDTEGYGIAEIDRDSKIIGFVEKPARESAPSNLANAGIYMINPEIKEVFNHCEVRKMIFDKRLDFGMDLIPYIIKSGHPVYGYVLQGEWLDVGTPEKYLASMRKVLNSKKISSNYEGRIFEQEPIWIEGASIESLSRREMIVRKVVSGKVNLEGTTLIGRHCQIGEMTRIKDSCIDNYSIIGNGVVIEDSAVMDRAVICDYVEIRNSIIGRQVKIYSSRKSPTQINDLSVIGDDVTVMEGSQITASKIYPHNVIPPNTIIKNQILE
jgi:NDP-sugar pyrophosphorylase family protein